MATVKISAWDVAELLGLQFIGSEPFGCNYLFELHGKRLVEVDGWDDETAKERMAGRLLTKLGENLSKIID